MNAVELYYIRQEGFEEADQIKDFGSVIDGVLYFKRKQDELFYYVSLTYYENKFCEACFEVFMKEKNTRSPKGKMNVVEWQKGGYLPVFQTLLRTDKDVIKMVGNKFKVSIVKNSAGKDEVKVEQE